MVRTGATVAVVFALLLAGCVGSGGVGLGGDSAADTGAESGQMSAGGGDGGSGGDSGSAAVDSSVAADAVQQDRAIIRTGRMVLEVENFTASRAAIAEAARSRGGYVSDSTQRRHRTGDATWLTGSIVVRVPAERYGDLQTAVGEQGVIITEETTTEDVTDQLVDLNARIENLEERRDRLRTFYSRANDTDELLEVEAQLSEVQGEIERLEAQRRSLEQRVAYSTLRVELEEPSPSATQIRTQYHEQSLVGVFLQSVDSVVVFLRASLVTLAAAAPWLAVAAVPALGLRRLLRGRSLPSIRSGGGSDEAASQSGQGHDDDDGGESDGGDGQRDP